jgi:hypothetical protein
MGKHLSGIRRAALLVRAMSLISIAPTHPHLSLHSYQAVPSATMQAADARRTYAALARNRH